MKTDSDNINLEEAIADIRCTTGTKLDERILSDGFAAFDEAMRSKHSIWRIIFKSRISRLTIAAVLIIGCLIAAKLLLTTTPEKPPTGVAKRTDSGLSEVLVPEELKEKQDFDEKATAESIKTELKRELKQIEDMFVAKDIEGLIAMLSDHPQEIRLAAALYLANIGDERAAEALRRLGSESDDERLAAIFSIVSSSIENRLEETKKAGRLEAQQSSAIVPKRPLSGQVSDAETAEAVIDAVVTISSGEHYTATTDANGFYCFEDIGKDGNYKINVTSKEYIGITEQEKLPVVYLSSDSSQVKNFKLEKACMIDLLVMDEVNEPVSNVEIFVTNPGDKNDIIDTGFEQITDRKGFLVLGGLDRGTFNLTAIHRSPGIFGNTVGLLPDYAPHRVTIKLENPNDIEYKEIVLRRGAEVRGQAQFEDGSPGSDLIVTVQPVWWDLPFEVCNYVTEHDGGFELENIADGTYLIRLMEQADSNDILKFETELPLKDEPFVIIIPKEPGVADSNIPDFNIPDANMLDVNLPDVNIIDVNILDFNIPDSNTEQADFEI
jgi:hypothetical protein